MYWGATFQNPHLVAAPVCQNLPLQQSSSRLEPFPLQLLLGPGPWWSPLQLCQLLPVGSYTQPEAATGMGEWIKRNLMFSICLWEVNIDILVKHHYFTSWPLYNWPAKTLSFHDDIEQKKKPPVSQIIQHQPLLLYTENTWSDGKVRNLGHWYREKLPASTIGF